jgi:hypothetical protein
MKPFLYALVACQLLLLSSSGARADSFYSNSNSELFTLPRNAAMANADITFSRDATSQSNPAIIPFAQTTEVNLSYSGYYLNTFSTSIASGVMSVNKDAGVGMSINYLHIPNIENTNFLETEVTPGGDTVPIYDPSKLKMVSSSDIGVNVAYGQKFNVSPIAQLSVGGQLHGLRRKIPTATDEAIGYGIGVDAGVAADFPLNGVRLSLLLNDLTTNFIYWNHHYKDQGLPHLHAGFGWEKEIAYIYGKFRLTYKSPDILGNDGLSLSYDQDLDTVAVNEGAPISENPFFLFTGGHFGGEYVIRDIVALRAGYWAGKVSFGGGISPMNAFSVDFAYTASDLPGTYAVALSYRW